MSDIYPGMAIAGVEVVRWGSGWWECSCECGTPIRRRTHQLRNLGVDGWTGCKPCWSKRQRKPKPPKPARPERVVVDRVQYKRWKNLIYRCTRPDHQAWKNYGGRGITVFDPWLDYRIFLEYVVENLGPCPDGYSLDRIDNDGNYEPGNIRWADRSTQRRNQRK